MTALNPVNSTYSKIIGIQFGLLSPDEIRKGSVVEIKNRDTYTDGRPVSNGLFDPRMGVLDPGFINPTDGLDYMMTPGYHGHLELARPVFYAHFLSTIQKVLKCVCFRCSKLLIDKAEYCYITTSSTGADRLKQVWDLAKSVKVCGEHTSDGCGLQTPSKIKRDTTSSLSLYAEWDEAVQSGADGGNKIQITPEFALIVMKRISMDDAQFMGFTVWSRPEWMICQVLLVPPPAIRPSVRHDSQQRSEDDLTHILVNIIKTNNTLFEKIQTNAPENVVQTWSTMLTYHISSLSDNNISGVNPVAQRSGRPLKAIRDRLTGKTGRIRGNLMAKRVNFSARSVITADPNISIRELGIPLKIAKNITKPVVVNDRNRAFLSKLIFTGPDEWPGANKLERRNGVKISLKYADKRAIVRQLENGDIVHRHLMNGDVVLFNRQPTLHRMSMMGHIARIMMRGDTFRMNVADTKPYNADFDGDEMNMHMPQNVESEAELMHLAAVPYQIISPANNSAIIGIYQDSMLGCFLFTRNATKYRTQVQFTPKDAMTLLIGYPFVNTEKLRRKPGELVTNTDILTQIMPPMSFRAKNKQSSELDSVVEIKNGVYVRGQIDSSVTKRIIPRICNDYGNMAAAGFIDHLQNIVTEYMIRNSFSVGISDLIVGKPIADKVVSILSAKKTTVKTIVDQLLIGVFENATGKNNIDEFETQVNNILGKAQTEAGREVLNNLKETNRFVIMSTAGSKGSEINIQQMTACLGQQNVDGKRIPYSFDNRTLPHFTKYDDMPAARGFVESSFINGLNPTELFFHAMGGRIGLIDTAVKTSSTGYIQRRLVKALEDLKVEYDMTVRNSKGKIVQYTYGGDSFDPTKVEPQELKLAEMSTDEIYARFSAPSEKTNLAQLFTPNAWTRHKKQHAALTKACAAYTDMMIKARSDVVANVFKNKSGTTVFQPVQFANIIQNIAGNLGLTAQSSVDITILEAIEQVERGFHSLEQYSYAAPPMLFRVMYFYYLAPVDLLVRARFNAAALHMLIQTVLLQYKRALIAPGEMVGIVAAQSIGEPTTQMTLNTFHFAGMASKSNVTRGVPRIEELLSLTSVLKNPSLTIYMKPSEETDRDKAIMYQYMIERTLLQDILKTDVEICFDPDDSASVIDEDRPFLDAFNQFSKRVDECNSTTDGSKSAQYVKWIIRLTFDPAIMLEKNITMDDVHYALSNLTNIQCIYSDYNSDSLVCRIRVSSAASKKQDSSHILEQTNMIYMLKHAKETLITTTVLRGIDNIDKVILRKIKDTVSLTNGKYEKRDAWVLDTVGTNLAGVLALDYIDATRTYSNDVNEIYNVLGIEAARRIIYNEIIEVIEFDGGHINSHHPTLLCDRMTYSHKLISVYRHGINNDDIGPIAKASFEETPEMFLKAAKHGELDLLTGISANVMCGQEGTYGTAAFKCILDMDAMKTVDLRTSGTSAPLLSSDDVDMALFTDIDVHKGACRMSKITVDTNIQNIASDRQGAIPDEYDPFL